MVHKRFFLFAVLLLAKMTIFAKSYIFEGIEWVSVFTELYSFNNGIYCKSICDNEENWSDEKGKYTIYEENSYTIAEVEFENHISKMFLFFCDDRHLIIYDTYLNKQITCTNSRYHIDEAYIWAVSDCSATSYLTETLKDQQFEYKPENLADNNITKKWVEGVSNNGEGEIIRIKNALIKPKRLYLINGFFDPQKTYLFYDNARIKDCLIRCYDSENKLIEEFKYQFTDMGNLQQLVFKKNYSFFEIEIKSVYLGKKYNDTAISAIMVDGLSGL